jgi:hypothetical protein
LSAATRSDTKASSSTKVFSVASAKINKYNLQHYKFSHVSVQIKCLKILTLNFQFCKQMYSWQK